MTWSARRSGVPAPTSSHLAAVDQDITRIENRAGGIHRNDRATLQQDCGHGRSSPGDLWPTGELLSGTARTHPDCNVGATDPAIDCEAGPFSVRFAVHATGHQIPGPPEDPFDQGWPGSG